MRFRLRRAIALSLGRSVWTLESRTINWRFVHVRFASSGSGSEASAEKDRRQIRADRV